jgi:hypothetical protein
MALIVARASRGACFAPNLVVACPIPQSPNPFAQTTHRKMIANKKPVTDPFGSITG